MTNPRNSTPMSISVVDSSQISTPTKGRQLGQVNKTRSKRAIKREEACSVLFSIFQHTNGKWYLQKPRKKNSACVCHNHLQVLPEHITHEKSILQDDIIKVIESFCTLGIEPSVISEYVIKNHGVIISTDQICDIKSKMVNNILIELDLQPSNMSNADKLIALFQNDPNVNYIYVMHEHPSGFVTYRKVNNGNDATTETVGMPSNIANEINISSWRESLSLDESNKVLVAFAWCHKEESRKVKINPQFIACDLTFGVNKENRNELLLAGIDGNNKSFTAFRCFMPSKQKRAYMWAIGVAFPVLVGETTCKRVRVFAHDNEDALVKALKAITNRPDSKFPHATSILDLYHFFKQRWQKYVSYNIFIVYFTSKSDITNILCLIQLSSPPPDAEMILEEIKEWIESWFYKLETDNEYSYSKEKFLEFYQDHKQILGNSVCMRLDELLNDIDTYKDMVCHHKQMGKTKFSFVSSSICEGTNYSLKYGVYKTKATQSIHVSGTNQIKQTEAKTRRDNITLARNVITSKLWTKLPTSKCLCDYIEGLICDMVDTSDYEVVYVGNKTWLVFHSSIMRHHRREIFQNPSGDSQTIAFDRCRIVSIDDDGYMKCNCGNVDDFLAPCSHCIAVLLGPTKNVNNISPIMFAPRYWELLNYYFMTDFGEKLIPNSYQQITKMHSDFYRNGFSPDGKFRGILIPSNIDIFYNENMLDIESNDEVSDSNQDYLLRRNIAKALLTCIEEKEYCVSGSRAYEEFMNHSVSNNNNEDSSEDNDDSSDHDLGMGGLSSADYQLSQQEHVMRDDISIQNTRDSDDTLERGLNETTKLSRTLNTDILNTSSTGTIREWMKQGSDVQNAISEAADLCTTEEHKNELQNMCLEFINECIHFSNKRKGERNQMDINNGQTTFYGEFNNSRLSQKRRRPMFEKFCKY